MRALIALAAIAAALSVVSVAGGHIRYDGCDVYPIDYPDGTCEYFRGVTSDPGDHHRIDPINVIWYHYGTLPRVEKLLENQYCWPAGDTSDQVNHRLVGGTDPATWHWAWAQQELSRATQSWPASRYHARVFRGHNHDNDYYDWSVSDAHHESFWSHHPDRDWDDVEAHMRSVAVNHGHSADSFWTYLPRADDYIQGYWSDGWASRIGVGGSLDLDLGCVRI